MNNSRSAYFYDSLARSLSVIFHPVLMPVYGMAIIFSAPTLYYYIPFAVKKLVILIILVNNVLLPLSLMPFFIHSKLISSWSVSERKDRIIPLIISTILYAVTTYVISRLHVSYFLKSYILAVAFVSFSVTVINFRWKISLHSAGAGALLALVLSLSFKMHNPLLWYLVPTIIASGLVLSSRLQLNLHNPGQVWLGFLTGILGLSVGILLL